MRRLIFTIVIIAIASFILVPQVAFIVDEILRLGKAPQVLQKFQDDLDYTKYKYKGKCKRKL